MEKKLFILTWQFWVSLHEGKSCKISLLLRCPQTLNSIWNKPNLITTASLCSDFSQYAMMFSQSLINADFFYFWDKPWCSDEFSWRLHCIPYLGSLGFQSEWSFTENASFINFHGEIWPRYSEINSFKISNNLFFQKWQKETIKMQVSKATSI